MYNIQTESGVGYVGRIVGPVEVTLVHPRGGDEARHGQTGEDLMKGSDRIGKSREQSSEGTPAPIFSSSGRVKGARRGKEIDYETAGAMADLKPALKMINTELSRLVQNLSPEDQEKFKTDSEFRAELREKAQIVGLKEAMKLEGLIKKLAENEAYELMHVLELSRRGVRAGEAKAIPMVGSGLFAESLFKYALVVEDLKTGEKKVGFDDIEEIGGFTKQATAFRIKASRDTRLGDSRNLEELKKDTEFSYEFTDPDRQKLFAGKKVYLDWDKVMQLAEAARQRFEGGN